MEIFDVVVLGGGAAGLFCAAQVGQAGGKVLLIDNGKKVGRKILMSGGGRCNFTNLYIQPSSYLSHNPRFCISALKRYTQWDFIELVERYGIAYHEKTLGQLFCDGSAQQIVNMLLQECQKGKVALRTRMQVLEIKQINEQFIINCTEQQFSAKAVVIATGGLSMPSLGATPFGYQVATQFGLSVLPTRAALVPFTLHKPLLEQTQSLSGVALPISGTTRSGHSFEESMLFTHRGLSGPAMLQLSSYWNPGELLTINLLPHQPLEVFLRQEQQQYPKQSLKNCLSKLLPKRLVELFIQLQMIPDTALNKIQQLQLTTIIDYLTAWQLQPNGTEGYRTAEVTLGGIDTNQLSSKTLQANNVSGLYFIGEVVDVTGWLGGYNFQWAWSSAWACAQALIGKHNISV